MSRAQSDLADNDSDQEDLSSQRASLSDDIFAIDEKGDGVEISNLLVRYSSGNLAVNQLSLSLKDGEITSLLGQNGAGKTTTIRVSSCSRQDFDIENRLDRGAWRILLRAHGSHEHVNLSGPNGSVPSNQWQGPSVRHRQQKPPGAETSHRILSSVQHSLR